MKIKPIVSPILRSLKTVGKLLIPFYSLSNSSSKTKQLPLSNAAHAKRNARRNNDNYFNLNSPVPFDDYLTLDVDNRERARVYLYSRSFFAGFSFPFFFLLITAALVPVIGPLAPIVGFGLGILATGIVLNCVDFVAKHSMRLVSWLRHRNDANVINPTSPQKYRHFNHGVSDALQAELTQKEHRAMQKLYEARQTIKKNPEDWLDISSEQKEQLQALDLSIKFYRNKGRYVGKEAGREDKSYRYADNLTRFGISAQMQNWVNTVIDDAEVESLLLINPQGVEVPRP